MNMATTSLFLLAVPAAAYGYTDPGSGIFLFQAMTAALFGYGFMARRAMRRLLGRGGKG